MRWELRNADNSVQAHIIFSFVQIQMKSFCAGSTIDIGPILKNFPKAQAVERNEDTVVSQNCVELISNFASQRHNWTNNSGSDSKKGSEIFRKIGYKYGIIMSNH